MKLLQIMLINFFIISMIACAKPASDYSGTWIIDYGDQQRSLTIVKKGDTYELEDELKKIQDDKIIQNEKSIAKVNKNGELQYGQNGMINTITLNDVNKQVTLQTFDQHSIVFDKK